MQTFHFNTYLRKIAVETYVSIFEIPLFAGKDEITHIKDQTIENKKLYTIFEVLNCNVNFNKYIKLKNIPR